MPDTTRRQLLGTTLAGGAPLGGGGGPPPAPPCFPALPDPPRRQLLGTTLAGGAAAALPESAAAKPRRRARSVDVVVVGAGFAGLTAARQVRRAGHSVL